MERLSPSCLSQLSVPVLLATTSTVLAQPQEGIWTPETTVGLRSVSDVSLDPTGRCAAYVLSIPRDENDEPGSPHSEIWLTSIKGGEPRRSISPKGNSSSPQLSPDGKMIAFRSTRQGQDSETQLCRIAADRGEASALTRNKTSVSAFRWSPDG